VGDDQVGRRRGGTLRGEGKRGHDQERRASRGEGGSNCHARKNVRQLPGTRVQMITAPQSTVLENLLNSGGRVAEPEYSSIASTSLTGMSSMLKLIVWTPSMKYCGGQPLRASRPNRSITCPFSLGRSTTPGTVLTMSL